MQNEIMDAVTRKLSELFGDRYTIYTDSVEQSLSGPCFFVRFLEPSEKPLLGRRYMRTYDMSVQYFPENPEPSRELNDVTERLMDGLEYITLRDGAMRRGRDRSGKVSDEVLTFFVTYDVIGTRPGAETDPMEALVTKGVCV